MKSRILFLVLPMLIWMLRGGNCSPMDMAPEVTSGGEEAPGRASRSIQLAPRSQLEQSFLRFGKSQDLDWSEPSEKRSPEETSEEDSEQAVGSNGGGLSSERKPPKRTRADYFRAILSRRSDLDKNFMRFGRGGIDRNFLRFGRPSSSSSHHSSNFLRFGRGDRSSTDDQQQAHGVSEGKRRKRSVLSAIGEDGWEEEPVQDQEVDEEEEEEERRQAEEPMSSLLSESERLRHVRPFYVFDPAAVKQAGSKMYYSEAPWWGSDHRRFPPVAQRRFTSFFPLFGADGRRMLGTLAKRTWGNIDNNFIRFG